MLGGSCRSSRAWHPALRGNPARLHATEYPTIAFSPRIVSFATPLRAFSRSTVLMTATKIDGTAIAKTIRERLNAQIKSTQERNPRYKPSLVIIQG